jgi:hypothetical protein
MSKNVTMLCLPEKTVSRAPSQILSDVLQSLGEYQSKDEMTAMGRMITWLGLGTPDRSHEFGCESAWNKDPAFGVIGIQSGPRG